MSQLGLLKYSYIAYLSKPAADRVIYRAIRRHKVRSIVEIGLGMGQRSQRMLAVAARFQNSAEIRYTGIDLFEARSADNPGVTLKFAYRMLRRESANVRLIPGDPFSAVARVANMLAGTDLVVISADQDPESLARAWPFLPRMLDSESLVFRAETGEHPGDARFSLMTRRQIEILAGSAGQAARKAA